MCPFQVPKGNGSELPLPNSARKACDSVNSGHAKGQMKPGILEDQLPTMSVTAPCPYNVPPFVTNQKPTIWANGLLEVGKV